MDRRRRLAFLAAVLAVLVLTLGLQAATAGSETTRWMDGTYDGDTLLTVQSYGWFGSDNGKAFIVDEDGTIAWEFDPPDTRVFDGEMLATGNVQLAVGTRLPLEECPDEYANDHCILNRVIEVDVDTNEIVWEYSWTDAFMSHHEVHDADRLPTGEVAIADMGNNRAFIVDQDGEITWSWRAENHIAAGTEFWEQYVPADRADEFRKGGPESDWTHLNDIDLLPSGNIQLSIRNFDVVLEIERDTKEIVDVIGRPGDHEVLNEQHNPNRLANETLLVADSENDRIVEIDVETGEPFWSYSGGSGQLAWPRDADRLPNGNTLLVDSRNFRVLEINTTGNIVWEYSLAGDRGIVYDADRLGLPEEPTDVPTAKSFGGNGTVTRGSPLVTTVESWAGFIFPPWVRFAELLTIAGMIVVSLALLIDSALYLTRDRNRRSVSRRRGE